MPLTHHTSELLVDRQVSDCLFDFTQWHHCHPLDRIHSKIKELFKKILKFVNVFLQHTHTPEKKSKINEMARMLFSFSQWFLNGGDYAPSSHPHRVTFDNV